MIGIWKSRKKDKNKVLFQRQKDKFLESKRLNLGPSFNIPSRHV